MSNKFLRDNFAPVQTEHTVTSLEVTGHIPEQLDGRYLRNGPNPISEVDPAAYHWFLGDGMVHGVRLRDGKAQWYRNRWVRSPFVAEALGEAVPAHNPKAGSPVVGANTNVIGYAGRTLALVEAGVANYELTEELDTVGPCDFDGTLTGGYTAHPKRDPLTGELHAVSYHFGRGNTVQYSVIDTNGRARRTVDIEVSGSPMMHDFSLTENYVVFYDLPVTFAADKAIGAKVPSFLRRPAQLVLSALVGRVKVPDPISARAMASGKGRSLDMPYRWDPSYPARVGVMAREGSTEVRWFDVDPCYVFHTLGAYEDGEDIVCDVVRHRTMFATDSHGPDGGPPELYRWTIDRSADKVIETKIDDNPQEFPRADERLLGRKHRFGYGLGVADGSGVEFNDTVLRHDFAAGTTQRRSLGAHAQGGEFVFVPNGEDSAEDDGVLMGFVYDAASGRSDLRILDAASLEDVASVHLPARVPHGFHGNWVPVGG
jgi:carotenoid cleavage dioxygenase